MKPATGRWVAGAREFARQHDALSPAARVERKIGREQRPRIGVGRIAEQGGCRPTLDNLAEIHHRHAIRDTADDVEIMRDQQVAQPQAVPQSPEQIEQFTLNGDVEAGPSVRRQR